MFCCFSCVLTFLNKTRLGNAYIKVDMDRCDLVLYTNIDLKLRHFKIGVTCVFNGHVFYTLL